MDPIEWITSNLEVKRVETDEMYYSGESQSGYQLPLIYIPFDPNDPGHWADRGQALDYSMVAGPGRVLDFGPGDGWPSLIVAPFVEEVVGVDGSKKRVEVCAENARRMGLKNASFVHVPAGKSLPFEDASFDGVMASASIEETPDPRATLQNIYRILRPGGRLRFRYNAYIEHSGRPERELELRETDDRYTHLSVWDRHLDEQHVRHIRLGIRLTNDEVSEVFRRHGEHLSYAGLTPEVLSDLRPHLLDALTCTRIRPTGETFLRWLRQIGFSSAQETYEGGWFARHLFSQIPESERPTEIVDIDLMLRPVVKVVITMRKPVELNGTITAMK